jgi:osmotically-inducible protein OsmY
MRQRRVRSHRRDRRRISWLLAAAMPAAAALVATAITGCGAAAPAPSSPDAHAATNAADAARRRHAIPPATSDAHIVAVLLRELQEDRVAGRARIEVDAVDGVLTLQGDVPAQLVKERAMTIAQAIRGVRAVIDRMVVGAKARPDYELEFLAASTLSTDHVTFGEPIAAKAKDGVVRLTGNVDSEATRWIAEADMLAIPGVLDVADDMAVTPWARSDGRLLREVTRIVSDDPWLDDARMRIAVNRQVVVLSGAVNSAAERARAERDARACSADGVDVTALRIDAISDGTLREQPAPPRSDDDLTRAFLDAVARDPRVRPFVPGVQVRDRVALLTGEAPNRDAARAAAEDARNVPGMADTHVDLKVAAAAAADDDDDGAVVFAARGVIDRDPRLSSLHIVVGVLHGQVDLRGKVPSEVDRRRAVAAVAGVAGARGVDDELVVENPTLPKTPAVTSR